MADMVAATTLEAVDILGLMKLLPHRYPFLLIDRMYDMNGEDSGVALKNVGGSFYDFVAERYTGTRCERLASPPDEWGGRAVIEWTQRLGDGVRFTRDSERLVQLAEVLDQIYARGAA